MRPQKTTTAAGAIRERRRPAMCWWSEEDLPWWCYQIIVNEGWLFLEPKIFIFMKKIRPGKIFFVTVWIFYDSQQEGEKSKSSRARSSFLIPERRHSHQRPHQFGPGRSLRFEPATTGSISAVTSCAPSTLPPTPAAARRRQETTTEEVSGTS